MSAVQFNLLPDVKLEFNRAQHAKRVVYGLSALTVAIALALFIISFLSVDVLQKKLLDSANNDITHYSNQLKSIPNLDKILTIQNQLNSLPALHQRKHYVSRLFSDLPQLIPVNTHVGKLNLDTSLNTLEITGTSDTVESVNKFVDTLKFTNYVLGTNQSGKKAAFSNVILSKVDRNDKETSYTINATFDPTLFTSTNDVTLVVPQEVTTRSVINTPDTSGPLFNGDTGTKKTQPQGSQ